MNALQRKTLLNNYELIKKSTHFIAVEIRVVVLGTVVDILIKAEAF